MLFRSDARDLHLVFKLLSTSRCPRALTCLQLLAHATQNGFHALRQDGYGDSATTTACTIRST